MNHANLTATKFEELVNPFNEAMVLGRTAQVDVVTSGDCMIEIGNKVRCGLGRMPFELFKAEADIAFRNAASF